MADTTLPKQTIVTQIAEKRYVGITPDQQRIMIDGASDAKTGMSPMDLLLNAVGGCAAFDIAEMIKKRRLTLHDYRIELTGERADTIPRYYTHIHAKHIFNVPGLDQKTAERFVELGMTKYCSVASSLKSDITFEAVLETAEEVA
ncbi:MAG: OsmC family protein [Deinococcota bacterium]